MNQRATHPSTVLVTGGAGYIGSHVVLALRARGERVVVLDDLSTGRREVVPADVPLVVGDIGDRNLLDRLLAEHAVDVVMHFAGSIVAPESVALPLDYYANNTCKTRTLIAAAVAAGTKGFLFSSTAAVYGEPKRVPVAEDAPCAPINPYGWSKLMSERMLLDASAAHGLSCVILRYFNVAGADPEGRSGQCTPEATHLIKRACEVALGRRERIAVYGIDYPTADGSGIRDYIHVSDLAGAHVLAADHLRRGGGNQTLNCGYGRGYSVLEVLASVERVGGRPLNIDRAPRRPGDPASLIADGRKARQVLGWQPRHDDLDHIVRTALAWEERRADVLGLPDP